MKNAFRVVRVRHPLLLLLLLPVIAVVFFFFGLLLVGSLFIPRTSRKKREALHATEQGGHFQKRRSAVIDAEFTPLP